jgi:type III secretory pathway component EscS
MIITESLRILLLLTVPFLVAAAGGGVVAGILQSFLRISESALIYGVKLVCLGVAIMVILPTLIESFQGLLIACMHEAL